MKILVVSAHFPPNFVSGGTLAPQRQAQGLRSAGFDVSVYAGWQGEDRSPLDTFDTVDESGVPIHWVVTTPWTAWSDTANYDNPGVTAHFEKHLAALTPDLVHFHSLQSVGAGLLKVAARSGARIVVTMHDFWWWCARQFLVDRSMQPCSLVVSCGDCACEVDRLWLDARNHYLSTELTHADVILAPSRSAAEVLVANGAPVAKVRVDENGVPEASPIPSAVPSPGGTRHGNVRFLYAGGHERMKGAHILVDALRHMSDIPGWRLTAYGLGPYLVESSIGLDPGQVDVRPPFDPAQIEAVFSAADVLVVPSVMRESHSIVTREALKRGIPVVCAESIGPEEVIEHGHNGLVVPAADAPALADALRRLASEPGLVDRLRAGCAAVPIRSVAEQLDGLIALYRELADRSPAPTTPSPRRTVRKVVFLAGIEGAPLRYRARLPAEALGLLNVASEVRHYLDPALPGLCANADVVVAYRVPATVQVLDLLAACRDRGTPVLCDFDDLIFDPELGAEIPALSLLPPDEAALWLEGVRRYRTTMEACDAFIASTEMLRRHAEGVVGLPAERFCNGVGIRLARAASAELARPRSPGPVRFGYFSGTDTHDHDWAFVEGVIVETLDTYTGVELWLGGLVRPSAALDRFGPRVRRLPFLPWLELPAVLRDLDVNLAPLTPDSRFNEAKSAIKWLEAALTATPTVASGTDPFREAIDHGRNGLLADNLAGWRDCLGRLVASEDLRETLGRRARRDALLRWSPHLQANRYLEILESAPARPRSHHGGSTWTPVAHDEPFVPHGLEPYDAEPGQEPVPLPPAPQPASQRLLTLGAIGLKSVRDDGLGVTARRATTLFQRRLARAYHRIRAR